MRSQKALAFAYVIGMFVALQLSGCGGSTTGGGTTPPSTPTVSSATLTGVPAPATLQVPQTLQLGCSVTISDGTKTNACTITSSKPAVASINASNLLTAIAAGTTNLVATSTETPSVASAPVTLTVTPTAIAPTITSVTVVADPASIASDQTATCVATVQGTGSFDSTVTWTATNGTITPSGVLTPTGVGTSTCTATSTQDPTKSGSASVTVTRATPVISLVTLYGASDPWMFCGISCNKAQAAFQVFCKGCQAGDTMSFSGYWPALTIASDKINSQGVVINEVFGGNQLPNFIYFTDVPNDGTPASNTAAFAYVAGYNSAAHAANGELLNQYFGKAYLWRNTNGNWTNVESFTSGGGLNTVYETDGTNAYFVNGDYYALDGTLLSGPSYDGWPVSGTSAENGTVILTEPAANEIALYKPVANPMGPQQTNRVPVGVMPYTSVTTTINKITFGFVASVDGVPTLSKIDTNGTIVGSTSLMGITSWSDINAGNRFLTGGWPMAVFHSGTALGKLAFVATHDKVLLVYDVTQNSLPLLKTIPLPCDIPSAVDAIDATGQFVVSCIKVAGFTDSGTTSLSIDPVAGTATPRASTSKNFPFGFAADANNWYVFQGSAAPDVQPNK